MRILALVDYYPDPYKSYYDTQFASLVEQGHELRVLSSGQFHKTLNEKVVRYDLARNTSHYPTLLRHLPAHLPRVLTSALLHPSRFADTVALVPEQPARRRALSLASALLVGEWSPDFILIQGLAAAIHFSWLREMVPEVPIALYYHGGEIPHLARWSHDGMSAGFALADRVFTNTKSAAENAIGRGCPAQKIRIAPVGFMLRDFELLTPRSYKPNNILRLLSAGRMSDEKGHIYALQALKSLIDAGATNLHYSLIGRGATARMLEHFVEENGLQQYVTFRGQLTTAGLVSAMAEADVLIQPSVEVNGWAENQACAVQEAMLLKTLVITTRSGGVPECIPDEMQPYCVPPGDPAVLTEAIDRLHRLPVPQFQQLGGICREYVRERFDIDVLNREMIEETSAVVRGRPTGNLVHPNLVGEQTMLG